MIFAICQRLLFSSAAFFFAADVVFAGDYLVSPTSADLIAGRAGLEKYLQPTVSGRLDSALFGMVRDNGTRFHEGIDLRSVSRDENGIPQDSIVAVADGIVAHVCPVDNGSYGKYVVIIHNSSGIEFYSLYAHLAEISCDLKEHEFISAGKRIGTIGNTSNTYKIPLSSAHLHFEIGMMLGRDGFDSWYASKYKEGNLHGHYNGLNLVGADPLKFFDMIRSKKPAINALSWINAQECAFTVEIPYSGVPDILFRSPALRENHQVPKEIKSWEVSFTWFGMPIRFIPRDYSVSEVGIKNTSEKFIDLAERRGMLLRTSNKELQAGPNLRNYLRIIFNS